MAEKKVGAKTIEPVKTQALGSPKPPAVTEPIADPADAWIEAHPEGKDFTPSAEPVVATEAPPSITPAAEAPAAPSGEAKPLAAPEAPLAEPKASAPPAEAPVVPAAEVKPAAEPAKPAVVEPLRVTAEGKYVLAEGDEPWTGEQIVMALRERAQAIPKAKAADQFEYLFGMKFEEAEKQWKPVLQALWDHRERQDLVNDLLFNCTPEKFEYFQRCNAQYDTEIPPAQPVARPAQPVAAAVPPEVKQELDALKSWRAEQEKRTAVDRVNREMADAIAKYPFLASDIKLRDELLLTARVLNAQDPNLGIRDAVAAKASIYDAVLVARSAQPAQPQLAAVPALNGSPGASPTGTRPAPNNKPKSFTSLDDAVEEWAANDSKNYQ